MIKSIRILLTVATHYDYEVWKMCVKTTFLNRNLEEEVHMIQPEGYTSKEFLEKGVQVADNMHFIHEFT